MFVRTVSAGIAALLLSWGMASAATLDKAYKATSAMGSGNVTSDHSLWIKGGGTPIIGSDFDFAPAADFLTYTDGTATLTGKAVSQNVMEPGHSAGFDVAFSYDSNFGFTPTFKSENGSAAGADTFYLNLTGGTLLGTGLLKGLNLMVTRMPANGTEATQIGSGTGSVRGANNKNTNFGMAHWFFVSAITEGENTCTSTFCDLYELADSRRGDINVDLAMVTRTTPIPLPGTGLLILGGMGALAMARRQKTRTS